jgi:hypothetical protein
VDVCGEVVLDRLVRPVADVVDHNTRYSGITPEMLQVLLHRSQRLSLSRPITEPFPVIVLERTTPAVQSTKG